jgi:UDP-glucuronate 4-epimerase
MNIFITGVAGFIGYHVARKLLAQGHTVFGIDNYDDYYDVQLKDDRIKDLKKKYKKFTFMCVDLHRMRRMVEIEHFFEKTDAVIHLAAQAGVRYSIEFPEKYIHVNIKGFHDTLEFCRSSGIKKFIYASSSSVYGASEDFPSKESQKVDKPLSLYAATKASNELIAHAYSNIYDMSTIGLRFFNAYGTWNRPDMALSIFAKAMIERKQFPLYNYGKSIKDFTYVEDIADGIVKCIDCDCKYEIFNLGNNKNTNLMEFIEHIQSELAIAMNVPHNTYEPLMDKLPLQPGDVPVSLADVSKAKELLDWEPDHSRSVRDGVQQFVKWFVEYYNYKN